jgi:hypothetical protein
LLDGGSWSGGLVPLSPAPEQPSLPLLVALDVPVYRAPAADFVRGETSAGAALLIIRPPLSAVSVSEVGEDAEPGASGVQVLALGQPLSDRSAWLDAAVWGPLGAGAPAGLALRAGQVAHVLVSLPADRLAHPPAEETLSVAGAFPLEGNSASLVTAVVRRLMPPHPGDALPAGEDEAARLALVLPAGKGLRQAALAFGPDEGAAALADGGRGPTATGGFTPGADNLAALALSSPAAVGLSHGAFRGSGGGSLMAAARTLAPDLFGPSESEPTADEPAAPGSPEQYARLTEPALAPQAAGLLAAGIALDAAALKRAVQALVAPVLEAGGSGALYWLGATSWFLATALAIEAARRRRQVPSSCLAFPAIPTEFLPEGRS